MRSISLPILLLFSACTPRSFTVDDTGKAVDSNTTTIPPGTDDSETDTDTDADSDTDTDTDADTDTDTDTDPGEYTCDNLPEFNLGDQVLPEARAYHGITFDAEGNLIGWDGRSALFKTTYDGTRTLWVPGMRYVEQIDKMTDGSVVIVDGDGRRLARVTAEGGLETVAGDINGAYGVTTGPDGMLYIADGRVHRVDPATGTKTQLVQLPTRQESIHSLNFNLDSTRMYLGTIGRGTVYYVDLDADLNPISEPQEFATDVGAGWHDGVEVDTCGNVYVADYSTSGLYRISAIDGAVQRMVDMGNFELYGHGVTWGSGIGGWRADTLYQPQPYNGSTVREVVIGFGSGDTVRTWNGNPAPW